MTMLVWTGVALLVSVALAWAATRWLRHSLAAPRRPVQGGPADHGVRGSAVTFPTRRGRWLSGWLLDGDPGIGRVVVCHGWGVNRLFMLSLARPLQRAGWQVLLFDVRNHGNSDADNFSSMPRFAEDIVAAMTWLRRKDSGNEGPLIIAGHSVGAAATLLAAAWRDDVDGVISLSGFVHPERMMRRWLAARHVPFIPFGWLVLRYVEAVIGHRFATIAPVSVIRQIRVPVLIAHGRRDQVIPPVDAEALARAGDPETTRLVWLEGDHDPSGELVDRWPQLVAFLDRVVHGIASRKDRGHD